jgi:hypothetical protein
MALAKVFLSIGCLIFVAEYVTKVMYIQVPGNTLMVFMASEVLNVPYKLIHKQAKLIIKKK